MKKMFGLCVVGGLVLVTALCQAQPTPLNPNWGMTLTVDPPAQQAQWLALWDQNITGTYTGYDTAKTAVGEDLDWLITPPMEGFYYGWMATHNTKYVDMFASWANDFLIRAKIEPDGYPGWPAPDASGTPVTLPLGTYNADSMLGDAAVFRTIILMSYQMINDPALQAKYLATGLWYRSYAELIYRKWVSRGGWQPTTENGVAGEIPWSCPRRWPTPTPYRGLFTAPTPWMAQSRTLVTRPTRSPAGCSPWPTVRQTIR